jgi:hypothetical protein
VAALKTYLTAAAINPTGGKKIWEPAEEPPKGSIFDTSRAGFRRNLPALIVTAPHKIGDKNAIKTEEKKNKKAKSHLFGSPILFSSPLLAANPSPNPIRRRRHRHGGVDERGEMLLPCQGDVPAAAGEAAAITGRCRSVPGRVAAGTAEDWSLCAGAPNLRQAVESRDNENVCYCFAPWSKGTW